MKKIKLKLTVLFFFLITATSFSQNVNEQALTDLPVASAKVISLDSLEALYNREAICFSGYPFFYMKGDQKFKNGPFLNLLLKELSKSPLGKEEVMKYKKNYAWATGLIVLGYAGLGASIIVFSPVLGLVCLVPIVICIVPAVKAANNLEKARWFYNRDVLLKKLN